jgi:hypothetical protein
MGFNSEEARPSSSKGCTILGKVESAVVELSHGELVGRALEVLKRELGPFVEHQLLDAYKERWREVAKRFAPLRPEPSDSDFDAQALLTIIWGLWNEVFGTRLKRTERNLVSELRSIRNAHAHQEDFSYRDTLRALDTVERMLLAIKSPAAKMIEDMHAELIRNRLTPPKRKAPRPQSQSRRPMSRKEAIARVNAFYGEGKTRPQNSTFSNINSAVPRWWLDVPVSRLASDGCRYHNLLLYDDQTDKLYHLEVPCEYFGANRDRLPLVRDGNFVRLTLSTDTSRLFRNVAPVDSSVEFKQFLRATA